MIEQKDIEKLALMSRIELREGEAETLVTRIGAVLDYVAQVRDITATPKKKEVGAVYNIMREDEVTREADEYTTAILENAPARKGRFIEVKKVLVN